MASIKTIVLLLDNQSLCRVAIVAFPLDLKCECVTKHMKGQSNRHKHHLLSKMMTNRLPGLFVLLLPLWHHDFIIYNMSMLTQSIYLLLKRKVCSSFFVRVMCSPTAFHLPFFFDPYGIFTHCLSYSSIPQAFSSSSRAICICAFCRSFHASASPRRVPFTSSRRKPSSFTISLVTA